MNQKDCILYDTKFKVKTPLLTNKNPNPIQSNQQNPIYMGHSIGAFSSGDANNVTFDTQNPDRVEFRPSDTNKPEQKLMKLEWVVLNMLDRAELNHEPYLIAKMRISSQHYFDKDIWSNNKEVEFNVPIPLKVPKFKTLGDSANYNLPSECGCLPPQVSANYWTEPSSKPADPSKNCAPLTDYCPSLPDGLYFLIEETAGNVSIDLTPIAGQYTLTELAEKLEELLNAHTISNNHYNVCYNGLTNKFSIKSNGEFKLKFGTGVYQDEGAYYFFGFAKTDTEFAYQHNSYVAFPPLKTVTIRPEDKILRIKEKLPTSRETAEFDISIPNGEYTYSLLANKLQECLQDASLRNGIIHKLGGHTGYQYIVTFDPINAKFTIKTCDDQEDFSILFQNADRTNRLYQILGFDKFNTKFGACATSDNQAYPIDIVSIPGTIPYVADRQPIPNPVDIELNDWGTVYLDDTYYCTQRVLVKPNELFFMKIVKSDGSDFREMTNPYVYLPCNHPLREWLPEIPDSYDNPCGYPFQINNLYRFAALVSFCNVPLSYSNSDKNGRVPPPIETTNINANVQGNYILPALIQEGNVRVGY